MTKPIFIDIKNSRSDLVKLCVEIEEFRIATKRFGNVAKDGLEGMNSDFVGKIKKVLEDVADNTSVKSCEDVQEFYDAYIMLLDDFEKIDTRISERFKKTKH